MESIAVLHVDDDPAMGELVADYLERIEETIEVRTVDSGPQALDVLEEERIDCILSDFDMPEMDGLELLAEVRDSQSNLPFVLFTGKGSEEIASEAISAGVTDYFQKKSGREEYELLATRITNAVTQFRAEQRARQHARVNEVLRSTVEAVVNADDRSEVFAAACESLAESDPYLFSVCVRPDSESEALHPVCFAGEDRGFIDAIESVGVRMDDTPTGQGPGGRAARSGEVQVLEDVHEDPAFEPWREHAASRGFESVAAIPLAHKEAFEGVIGVFADRPHAFDETERRVLSTLGSTIAYAAITASDADD